MVHRYFTPPVSLPPPILNVRSLICGHTIWSLGGDIIGLAYGGSNDAHASVLNGRNKVGDGMGVQGGGQNAVKVALTCPV